MLGRGFIRSWPVRSLAAAALTVFLLAQAVCVAHCHLGRWIGQSAAPSCHSARCHRAAQTGAKDPAPIDSGASSRCLTLKTMLNGGENPQAPEPVLNLSRVCETEVVLAILAEDRTRVAFERHDGTELPVRTPELSLGPACQSLAPPVLG